MLGAPRRRRPPRPRARDGGRLRGGDVGSKRDREAHRQLVRAALEPRLRRGRASVRRPRARRPRRRSPRPSPGLPVAVDGSGTSLLASALFCGEPLTADGRIPWAPAALPRAPARAARSRSCPAARRRRSRSRSSARDHAPFVAAELDRLAALMRVAAGDAAAARDDRRPEPRRASSRGDAGSTAAATRVLDRRGRDDHPPRPAPPARDERLRGLRRGARRRRGGRAGRARSSPT